jgi:hypothetical protein
VRIGRGTQRSAPGVLRLGSTTHAGFDPIGVGVEVASKAPS